MNYLLILSGLPASGKSTFARKFKDLVESEGNSNVKIIDTDIIRQQLYPNGFNYKNEKRVRKRLKNEIRQALNHDFIVVSDDLNYYTSMRHDLKIIAEKVKRKFFIVYISTPLEACLNWNTERGNLIPNNVIINVKNKFDDFDRYSWDYPILELDLSKTKDLDIKIKKLILKIQGILHPKDSLNRKAPKINKLYLENSKLLDKVTRSVIGEIFQNNKQHPQKKLILKLRKEYIKTYSKTDLSSSEIPNHFVEFLDKHLKTDI
ncbi:MAG: AAA family ATPase [Candidatus Hermodarchaeota archaeon]